MEKKSIALPVQRGPRPELYDTEQAAEYIDVKPHTLEVWRMNKRMKLPFIRIGRNVRYRRHDLDWFLDSRTVGAESGETP